MKILILHGSAGYGHIKAAENAGKALREAGGPQLEVKVEDGLDYMPKAMKRNYVQLYFNCVKHLPKLWGFFYDLTDIPSFYKMIQPLRTAYNRAIGSSLIRYVQKEAPEIILCTHFFSAEILATAKKRGEIKSALITLITDFMPHTTWINPGTDYYWVMNEATRQAVIARKIPAGQVIAKGIPVDPIFKPGNRREEILKKYHFQKDRFTILITSGSFGMAAYQAVLKELECVKDKIQCFVVCGNNEEMKTHLSKVKFAFPVQIFGFVNFMADLMEACDLMIAKSGGLTTSESLAKGIPMVVTQPIPGQETRNTEFLKAHEASFFMTEPSQARVIIQAILNQPEILAMKKMAIQKIAKPNASEELAQFILSLAKKTSS